MTSDIRQITSDADLRSLVNRFLLSPNRKQEILQRSLFSLIVQSIVSRLNNDPFKSIPIKGGGRKISESLVHLVWYILWTVKWLLFFRYSKHENIVTSAFYPGIYSSREYLSIVCCEANARQTKIVNFGMLYDMELFLFRPLFCHPFRWDRIFKPKVDSQMVKRLESSIVQTFSEFKFIDLLPSSRKDINRLLEYYSIVDRFLSSIKTKKKCIYFISDTDHLDTRVILCELHKSNNIQTVLVDHALNTYRAVNNQVYSDRYLCWGEYHKSAFAVNSSKYNDATVAIPIGRPRHCFQMQEHPKANRWIYFLPSFQHQTKVTLQRSILRTKAFIETLDACAHSRTNSPLLSVRPHPADSSKTFEYLGQNTSDKNYSTFHNECELFIIEDSTIILDLLQYDIPLLYITDTSGDDALGVEAKGVGRIVSSTHDVHSVINELLMAPIDAVIREKAFEHYIYPDHKMEIYREQIRTLIDGKMSA